jgi:hypothetical protein
MVDLAVFASAAVLGGSWRHIDVRVIETVMEIGE